VWGGGGGSLNRTGGRLQPRAGSAIARAPGALQRGAARVALASLRSRRSRRLNHVLGHGHHPSGASILLIVLEALVGVFRAIPRRRSPTMSPLTNSDATRRSRPDGVAWANSSPCGSASYLVVVVGAIGPPRRPVLRNAGGRVASRPPRRRRRARLPSPQARAFPQNRSRSARSAARPSGSTR
jgi:hypothetical protein